MLSFEPVADVRLMFDVPQWDSQLYITIFNVPRNREAEDDLPIADFI